MEDIRIVVAHAERTTVRVGDVFLKIDADQHRADREVEAMRLAPVPTPEVLWRQPPVLALALLRGSALGRLGASSTASPAAWRAAGATVRRMHDAPLPPWAGTTPDAIRAQLDEECAVLLGGLLPADLVHRNREIAEVALRPWAPVFIHGDLQVDHVFIDGDEVVGVLDWSEVQRGDALYDLATMTLGHQGHLEEVATGYGAEVDLEVVRAWWSVRSLLNYRWLVEHGFDPAAPGCELDVLRAAMRRSPA